ncbi:MarR family winged helix-turn-helix transcriptional regulator [Telmatospirillum siberiense]|nr:MarR family transcriptional regulator [Telmatospirillum siberiense]
MTRLYDAHLKVVDLTLTQYSVLAKLTGDVAPDMHRLAAVMGMDRTSLSRTLAPLEARGLIESAPGDDRRSRIVRLTETGKLLHREAEHHWRAAQDEIRERMGGRDLAQLHRLLDLVCERLAADPSE